MFIIWGSWVIYILYVKNILNYFPTGSTLRKQSLTIFHLSPSAVITKFCWKAFGILSWYLTVPLACIMKVNCRFTAISKIWDIIINVVGLTTWKNIPNTGCASNVVNLWSESGKSLINFSISLSPLTPFPFQDNTAELKYNLDKSWNIYRIRWYKTNINFYITCLRLSMVS